MLQVEETQIVDSLGGVEHREIRWRRATLDDAKMVLVSYHAQRNLLMSANFIVTGPPRAKQSANGQTEKPDAELKDVANGDDIRDVKPNAPQSHKRSPVNSLTPEFALAGLQRRRHAVGSALQHLCSVQRGKNIDAHHDFFHRLRVGRKSWKGLKHRLTTRAVPKVTNHLVIQEFRPMRCNDFVVAPNTAHSKHEHRRSFAHRA